MIVFEYSLPLFLTLAALMTAAAAGVLSARRFLSRDAVAIALCALFALTLLLLGWTLLMPARRDTVTKPIKPRFLIALDTSASMTNRAPEQSETRWHAARQALDSPWTRILGAESEIEVLPFDATVGRAIALGELVSLSPTGTATLLRGALREIAARHAGLNVAGILLLSDCLDTREASNAWADEPQPFPIFTVQLEPKLEWAVATDVRVESVHTPRRVTRHGSTELNAIVSGEGTRGEPFSVRLLKDDFPLHETVTAIPDEGGRREVSFTLEHAEPGIFEYQVYIPPLAQEVDTNNNFFAVSVYVSDESNQVLYVEGVPRWEYRFLRRALMADSRITPSIFYTGPDGTPRRGSAAGSLSAEMTETELSRFQAVILGNLDASELTEARAENLVAFVESGGSLILLGGTRAWGAHGLSSTALQKALPVVSHAFEPITDEHPFTVAVTDEGRAHPAFAGDETLWENTPSVLSIFPEALPSLGAQVLVTAETPGGPQPMVLTQRFGEGRVAAIFTDSLWRWQMDPEAARDEIYTRFWSQLLGWMMPDTEDTERMPINLFADRDLLYLGESIAIGAHFTSPPSREEPIIRCLLSLPDGREIPYAMRERAVVTPSGKQLMGLALNYTPEMPGRYTAVALADADNREMRGTPISFFVQPHSPETIPRPMNIDALRRIARSSGGRHFATLGEMNDYLSKLTVTPIEDTSTEHRSLWQSWTILILTMLLLTATWGLRKTSNMP